MGTAIRARELRLVDDAPAPPRTGRGLALAICAALGAAALLAGALGADRWRAPFDARRYVADTLNLALAEGNRAPAVLQRVRGMRAELGRRPLDSQSRVRYAALLLAMTRTLDDAQAPAFHARAAAELAPVTFPVVELAALILARTGDVERAAALVRDAFAFDPSAAAGLLLKVEESLGETPLSAALAATPEAWIAWSRVLDDDGRDADAAGALAQAFARWPASAELRLALARRAARSGDWPALGRWVERADATTTPVELELLAYRARWHAESGRRAEAEEDLAQVLERGADSPGLLALAGDTQARLGEPGPARRSWQRALFRVPADNTETRVALLVRLAELEERAGRASVALRHWRAVLELAPNHPRARRRVAELTGFET